MIDFSKIVFPLSNHVVIGALNDRISYFNAVDGQNLQICCMCRVHFTTIGSNVRPIRCSIEA